MRSETIFLVIFWNNSLMNDIILVFLVSVVSVFFSLLIYILLFIFSAAGSHECPSVPRGRIIRYGTD